MFFKSFILHVERVLTIVNLINPCVNDGSSRELYQVGSNLILLHLQPRYCYSVQFSALISFQYPLLLLLTYVMCFSLWPFLSNTVTVNTSTEHPNAHHFSLLEPPMLTMLDQELSHNKRS